MAAFTKALIQKKKKKIKIITAFKILLALDWREQR